MFRGTFNKIIIIITMLLNVEGMAERVFDLGVLPAGTHAG